MLRTRCSIKNLSPLDFQMQNTYMFVSLISILLKWIPVDCHGNNKRQLKSMYHPSHFLWCPFSDFNYSSWTQFSKLKTSSLYLHQSTYWAYTYVYIMISQPNTCIWGKRSFNIRNKTKSTSNNFLYLKFPFLTFKKHKIYIKIY